MSEYEKKNYSDAELRRYCEGYDFVIGEESTEVSQTLPLDESWYEVYNKRMSGAFCGLTAGGGSGSFYCTSLKRLLRMKDITHRRIGIVTGWNDDKSPIVKVLGSDSFSLYGGNNQYIEIGYNAGGSHEVVGDSNYPISPLFTYAMGDYSVSQNETKASVYHQGIYSSIALEDTFEYIPIWSHLRSDVALDTFLKECSTINGQPLVNSGDTLQLTNDPQTSLKLGQGFRSEFMNLSDLDMPTARVGIQRYEGCAGDLYTNLQEWVTFFVNIAIGMCKGLKESETYEQKRAIPPFLAMASGTFAYRWIPYNLLLTEDVTQAREYLRSGRIPSDAWCYPWNPDEFPTDSPIPPDGGGGDDDDGDDPGKSPTKDIDDMDTETPATTPQMLNANNLYWLQRGQLMTFIDWFWLDAGTVIEAGDLWDKIKGLYNDLASAVVNVRFMPVRPEWIGGVTAGSNIIVGQIECPMSDIYTINRGVQQVQNIGSINIVELHKNFIDYSPHAEITLYLPFHGYLSLDNDILEGEELNVRAVYDVISGTVQYFVYLIKNGNKGLINTCVAKMAVDIPITLQSKSDRDSAIFNNVSSAMGSLASAGVSLAMKNPVGVALSVTGAVAGGTQSAQLNVKGTVGESGAFFAPSRCAVFIKKTFYTLPAKYGFHVGYPCYKTLPLNDSRLKGSMVKIHNPYITFSGNKFSDNEISAVNKPLESEIQEIYELLEKGVIL